MDGDLPPGKVEGGEQQCRLRRRLQRAERPDHEGLQFLGKGTVPEVEERGLSQRSTELVHRGDHQVGAESSGVGGKPGVKAEVGTPSLVDDECGVVPVGDVSKCGHVGAGTEVRRSHDQCGAGVRVGGECGVESLRGDTVCDPEVGVEVGRDECGDHSRHGETVDDGGVHAALRDERAAEACHGQARREVALAGTVGEKPGAARTPGLGRELQRSVLGVVRADVDALDHRLDVQGQHALPDVAGQEPLGERAALMARNPPSRVVGVDERLQRIDVGGGVLTRAVEGGEVDGHAVIFADRRAPAHHG